VRQTRWNTRITDTDEQGIVVRGYDLADLIGRISFGEMFYLLSQGELPTKPVGKMIEAMLVACADHGIITTSVVARYVIASGTPLQGALAAGLLTVGDIYAGAVEQAAKYLQGALEFDGPSELDDRAKFWVAEAKREARRIPGFGHPLHPKGDPRSKRLFAVAHELGVAGPAVSLATAIEKELEGAGRLIPLNADGALAALVLDLGFDWSFARAFMLMSRTAGILAHSAEEQREGKPWRFPPPASHEVKSHEDYYQGVARRAFPIEGHVNGRG
jgi:citrate synthase